LGIAVLALLELLVLRQRLLEQPRKQRVSIR
jgi:hypothetical protein